MGRVCGMHVTDEKCIPSFGGKHELNRPLVRPGHRMKYDIKMERAWTGLSWLMIWKCVWKGARLCS